MNMKVHSAGEEWAVTMKSNHVSFAEELGTQAGEVKVNDDQSSPSKTTELPEPPRRSLLKWITGVGYRKDGSLSCCGTSVATLFVRVIFMIIGPPLFFLSCFFVSENTRTAIVTDAIRNPISVIGLGLLWISRFVVAANTSRIPHWGGFELFEAVFYMTAMAAAVNVVSPPKPNQGVSSYVLVSMALGIVATTIIIAPIHVSIKQVMQAQKQAFTMWVMKLVTLQLSFSLICLFLILYGVSVLTNQSSNLQVEAIAFVPLVLSGNYSCATQEHFVDFLSQSPISSPGVGCPKTSAGITMNSSCGFDTWEEACYRIGTIPVLDAVGYELQEIIFILGMVPIGLFLLLDGRGIIKPNSLGGLDSTAIEFVTRPRIMIGTGLCFLEICLVVFHFSELLANGAYLSGNIPMPPPHSPMSQFPANCYGKCLSTMYIFFLVAGFLTLSVLWSETKEVMKCCGIYCVDNRRVVRRLSQGVQLKEDLLNSIQQTILFDHLKTFNSEGHQPSSSKFLGTKELITGQSQEAVEGLQSFLCVDNIAWTKIIGSKGDTKEEQIIQEVNALCNKEEVLSQSRRDQGGATNKEVIDLLDYIVNKPCSEKQYKNGVRDQGRDTTWRLANFMKDEHVAQANLERCHVIALRLYTTSAYAHINGPLRDQERHHAKRPHPLPATCYYITQGIKKLRRVYDLEQRKAEQDGLIFDITGPTVLWRGMKGVHIGPDFMRKGGTELAPMSCTSDFKVAVLYGTSVTGSLLFKINVPNPLSHGADLQWLSAFPTEAEVLYPPLTFLQPKAGRVKEYTSNGYTVAVVEVEPNLSAGN